MANLSAPADSVVTLASRSSGTGVAAPPLVPGGPAACATLAHALARRGWAVIEGGGAVIPTAVLRHAGQAAAAWLRGLGSEQAAAISSGMAARGRLELDHPQCSLQLHLASASNATAGLPAHIEESAGAAAEVADALARALLAGTALEAPISAPSAAAVAALLDDAPLALNMVGSSVLSVACSGGEGGCRLVVAPSAQRAVVTVIAPHAGGHVAVFAGDTSTQFTVAPHQLLLLAGGALSEATGGRIPTASRVELTLSPAAHCDGSRPYNHPHITAYELRTAPWVRVRDLMAQPDTATAAGGDGTAIRGGGAAGGSTGGAADGLPVRPAAAGETTDQRAAAAVADGGGTGPRQQPTAAGGVDGQGTQDRVKVALIFQHSDESLVGKFTVWSNSAMAKAINKYLSITGLDPATLFMTDCWGNEIDGAATVGAFVEATGGPLVEGAEATIYINPRDSPDAHKGGGDAGAAGDGAGGSGRDLAGQDDGGKGPSAVAQPGGGGGAGGGAGAGASRIGSGAGGIGGREEAEGDNADEVEEEGTRRGAKRARSEVTTAVESSGASSLPRIRVIMRLPCGRGYPISIRPTHRFKRVRAVAAEKLGCAESDAVIVAAGNRVVGDDDTPIGIGIVDGGTISVLLGPE